MVWNGIIACYLFLAGMGAGSFAYATIAGWKNPDATKTKLAGMIVAIVAVAVGTLMLVVDAKAGLHNPARFFLLLTNWGSVMTWGVALLSAFLIAGFIDLIIMIRKKSTPKALDYVMLVLAFGVALYTGLLLGVSNAYPLWNIAILPILFLVSALSTGFAVATLFGQLAAKDEAGGITFHRTLVVWLPVIELALVALLLIVTASTSGSGSAAAQATIASLLSGSYALAFWGGLVVVGLVIPFVIEFMAKKKEPGVGALMAAELCVLVGGFLLRYLVIMAAVPIVF